MKLHDLTNRAAGIRHPLDDGHHLACRHTVIDRRTDDKRIRLSHPVNQGVADIIVENAFSTIAIALAASGAPAHVTAAIPMAFTACLLLILSAILCYYL